MMSLQNNLKRLEKGYISDLDNIIKDIVLNHTVYTLDHDQVDYSYLYKKYISPLILNEKVFQCSAISSNGNRCSFKSIKETNYLYCKKHIFKQKVNYQDSGIVENFNNININKTVCEESENIDDLENTENVKNIDKTNKTHKIIDDKLYYVDDTFIYKNDYKTDTLIKCGYIHDNNYILTDDPFILENIDPDAF